MRADTPADLRTSAHTLRPWMVAVALLAGCARPPEAPDQLDELCAYIYGHFQDEDPAALESAVTHLDVWLNDHFDEAAAGYVVNDLGAAEVDPLDAPEVDLSGLVGASVVTDIDHSVRAVTEAIITVSPQDIYQDTYSAYERQWLSDPECFPPFACEEANAFTHSESAWPLGLVVGVYLYQDYRWIETEYGPAMLQRTWLSQPADSSLDWLNINAQYFMAVNLPQKDGSTHRLQAMWVVAQLGDAAVPEDMALDLVIDSMQGEDARLDTWLDQQAFLDDLEGPGGHYEGGSCSSAPGPRASAGLFAVLAGALALRRRRPRVD
jgi:MYXO-CTERM domain-containing protein